MQALKYVTAVGTVPAAPISVVWRMTMKPSLVQAAAELLATHVPEERRAGAAGVERIDLDQDVPDDGWAEDE